MALCLNENPSANLKTYEGDIGYHCEISLGFPKDSGQVLILGKTKNPVKPALQTARAKPGSELRVTREQNYLQLFLRLVALSSLGVR
jgi:hypothetical protein